MDAHNGGVDAHNGGVEAENGVVRVGGAGSGSDKSDPDLHQSEKRDSDSHPVDVDPPTLFTLSLMSPNGGK